MDVNLKQIRNRLLSIIHDRWYLQKDILQKLDNSGVKVVTVPNARCGNWYTTNNENIESYFKSTDGHKDHWGFNYRRLNLHIFEKILEWDQEETIAMIVDSSKYRQIPDSLSKTIPIWCCILSLMMNKDYFEVDGEINIEKFHKITDYMLELPEQMENVKNEAPKIREQIIEFYKQACIYLPDIYRRLRNLLERHCSLLSEFTLVNIRPSWIYPGHTISIDDLSKKVDTFDGQKVKIFNLLLCSTSAYSRISRHNGNDKYQSNFCHNKYGFEFDYYQGAGDDHEMWGMNLINPNVFNDNIEKFENILKDEELDDTELLSWLMSLMSLTTTESSGMPEVYEIDSEHKVFITKNDKLNQQLVEKYDRVVVLGNCNIKNSVNTIIMEEMTDDKKGIRKFFKNIGDIEGILSSKKADESILFSSEKYDLNIACSLIYLIRYANINNYDKTQWSKIDIRQVYLKILEKIDVETKTSRLVLNNVNSYIMS